MRLIVVIGVRAPQPSGRQWIRPSQLAVRKPLVSMLTLIGILVSAYSANRCAKKTFLLYCIPGTLRMTPTAVGTTAVGYEPNANSLRRGCGDNSSSQTSESSS